MLHLHVNLLVNMQMGPQSLDTSIKCMDTWNGPKGFFLKGGGAFMAKIIFCFLSESECLDGMELVCIFIFSETNTQL